MGKLRQINDRLTLNLATLQKMKRRGDGGKQEQEMLGQPAFKMEDATHRLLTLQIF